MNDRSDLTNSAAPIGRAVVGTPTFRFASFGRDPTSAARKLAAAAGVAAALGAGLVAAPTAQAQQSGQIFDMSAPMPQAGMRVSSESTQHNATLMQLALNGRDLNTITRLAASAASENTHNPTRHSVQDVKMVPFRLERTMAALYPASIVSQQPNRREATNRCRVYMPDQLPTADTWFYRLSAEPVPRPGEPQPRIQADALNFYRLVMLHEITHCSLRNADISQRGVLAEEATADRTAIRILMRITSPTERAAAEATSAALLHARALAPINEALSGLRPDTDHATATLISDPNRTPTVAAAGYTVATAAMATALRSQGVAPNRASIAERFNAANMARENPRLTPAARDALSLYREAMTAIYPGLERGQNQMADRSTAARAVAAEARQGGPIGQAQARAATPSNRNTVAGLSNRPQTASPPKPLPPRASLARSR